MFLNDLGLADVAQLAERVLGKDEVTSSILVIGSILRSGSAKDAHRSSPDLTSERRWADSDATVTELRMASHEKPKGTNNART
jgi:hypothetical protein